MAKIRLNRKEILKKAKIIFILSAPYPDEKLIAYYNLCKDIVGSACQYDKPEIILDAFETVLNTLSEREPKIIDLRYGLNGCEPHTFAKIASIMGLSVTTIRNVCKHVIRKLRNHKSSVLYNVRIQNKKNERLLA